MMDPQDVTKNIGIRMVFNAAKKRQLTNMHQGGINRKKVKRWRLKKLRI